MSDLFFWRQWPGTYRNLYLVSLAVCLAALALYIIWHIRGVDATIHWQIQQQLQSIPVQVAAFSRSLFDFTIDSPTYFVTEQFVASTDQVHTTGIYIFLLFLALSVVLILSLITDLSRFWYIVGMGIFILLLASFKLDLLQVFGLRNNALFIASVATYTLLSYYFHAFRTDVSLQMRLFAFGALTLLFALLVIFFSRISYPLVSLAGNGIIIPVALSLVCIVMVSHEVMNGFLYLVTQSGGIGGRNSLMHFSLISLIYLINIALLYARNARFISWDIFYIHPFYLFLFSLLLGIWGFKKRNTLFDHIIPFYPNGAFLYLGLATISLVTIGYFFVSGNDSMLEMIEDIIVFSHLAMGVSFFIYVFINFRSPMMQGLPVYKVIYQPRQFPFFIARGVALLIMLALFFRASMYPMYQAFGGYYNVIADVHALQGEHVLAEQYYKFSLQYNFLNHKANYAVASQAGQREEETAAIFYLSQAIRKNPSAYAYGGLSNLYLSKGLFFDAVFNLQKGVTAFPSSGELYNNLALLYTRSNIPDSAYIYHQLASQYLGNDSQTGQTNNLAFWIRNNAIINTDSLLQQNQDAEYIPLQTNQMVLANMHDLAGAPFRKEVLPSDSLLTEGKFAYLYNYLINPHTSYDSTLAAYLSRISRKDENLSYNEDVQFALACYEYYKNDRARGLEAAANLSLSSPYRSAFFSKVAGLWFLQQKAPKRAAEFFAQTAQAGDSSVNLQTYQAVAFSEAGQWLNALAAWQPLALNPDVSTRSLARHMETISRAMLAGQPAFIANSLDDAGKSLLVHFSKDVLLPDVALAISNPDYRVQSLAMLAERCIAIDSLAYAASLLESARNTTGASQTAQHQVNAANLHLLLATKDFKQLLAQVAAMPVAPEDEDRKLFWQAFALEQTSNPQHASRLYKQALKRMPADTTVILQASRFFDEVQKNTELAYATLLEATLLNPYNTALQKAYILQCLDMQLLTYAENGMNQLRQITTDADYQSFMPVYEARKSSVEKMLFEWK